ncbi:MAG: TRAP transporter large permease subunit [Deltaproteobacteria bacterium]|nr:TRAP transporter large permease subunit [Deltaproteobacteria bacterium]
MTTIVLLCVLALMLIGARLFVVVGMATMLCFILIAGEGVSPESLVRIVNKMESLTTKNVFLSIPFFVGAGTVMTKGGMAARLIRVARALVGFMPGGLAIASVIACIVFSAITGSSPVTLVAVGSIMFPALVESKYPERAAMGLLTTAGSLGCLVPPSIAMLIYAICVSGSAAVDPSDLFLAGLIPALAITFMLSVYAYFVGRKVPEAREPFDGKKILEAVEAGAFALALPVIVLGGIYSGQFTPTEAGAVALAYSVIVTTVVHKELHVKDLLAVFSESATLIGSLVLIVVLAFGLNDFLAEIEAAERMGNWLRGAHLSPMVFLLIVNVALIFIGALMDSVSATLVFAPLLAPIALEVYGIDPIHFGVVFVVNMEIGYLAPPVATNLFVASAIFKRPFSEVTVAVLPTLAMVIAALGVIMYVPTLSKAALNMKHGVAIYEPFPWNGKEAKSAASQPADAPKKPLTMEEMMKRAQEQMKNAASQPATP